MKTIPIIPQKEILFPKKNLQDRVCLEPFNTVAVSSTGDVRMCGCSGWMPTSIGSIHDAPLDTLLNSDLASKIRQSIRDGTFQYCNESACGLMVNNQLEKKQELAERAADPLSVPMGWELFSDERLEKTPLTYFIAGDDVCNLSCPSCRPHVISQSKYEREQRHQDINVLAQQMFASQSRSNIDIHISTSGEVFASKLLLGFLSTFPIDRYPNSKIWIQTNGILLKKKWAQIEYLGNNIRQVAVTADSCRSEVYQKLRRGGQLVDLEDNLLFLRELKVQYGFRVEIRMVVQRDNCDEIGEFYQWAKDMGADKVTYMRIQNWGVIPPAAFRDIDVLAETHTRYKPTRDALLALCNKNTDVWVVGTNLGQDLTL